MINSTVSFGVRSGLQTTSMDLETTSSHPTFIAKGIWITKSILRSHYDGRFFASIIWCNILLCCRFNYFCDYISAASRRRFQETSWAGLWWWRYKRYVQISRWSIEKVHTRHLWVCLGLQSWMQPRKKGVLLWCT